MFRLLILKISKLRFQGGQEMHEIVEKALVCFNCVREGLRLCVVVRDPLGSSLSEAWFKLLLKKYKLIINYYLSIVYFLNFVILE